MCIYIYRERERDRCVTSNSLLRASSLRQFGHLPAFAVSESGLMLVPSYEESLGFCLFVVVIVSIVFIMVYWCYYVCVVVLV